MTSHIVISREELYDQLHRAFDAGWSKGNPSSSVENLVKKLDTRFVDWFNSRTVRVAHALPSGWLPISEAPKDGTWVLVAAKAATRTGWLVLICNWRDEAWRDADTMRFAGGHISPTHFLPLVTPE